MQKQSRVFFQISGAGHEAIGLALARHLRPGYDWFFPYYRDQALVLGLGVTPTEILMQAVGSADDPSSGGRQMPSHWGKQAAEHRDPVEPDRQPVHPGRRLRRGGPLHRAAPPARAAPPTATSSPTSASARGRAARASSGRASTPRATCTCRCCTSCPTTASPSRCPTTDQHPAPVAELVRGFRGLEVHRLDGTDYFAVRKKARTIIEHVRAGVGPALIHADVVRPYSHSAADTQSKYRSADELAEEASPRPHRPHGARAGDGRRAHRRARPPRCGPRRKEAVAKAAAEALAAPPPRPGPHHRAGLGAARGRGPARPTYEGGEPVPLGEAIKRTLHEVMAADERIRVFGEDVADAREPVLANVEGKGGVFGTTHGLQRAFGQARCFNTPLSEANIIGRAVGQALRGLHPAPEIQFFDYIWPAMTQIKSEAATIRWRSNGAFTVPMVVRVPIGGYLTGGAIWHSQCGESIFAHVPGLLDRLPVAGPRRRRAAALRLPVRGPGAVPRAQAPAAPALHRRPVPAGRLRHPVRPGRHPPRGRRPHHRVVGRHGREVAPGGGPGRGAGRASRPR